MESQKSIEQRALRVQRALEAAFGVQAKTLAAALRRTGRRMPKRLHADARLIVDAQGLGGHPKLMRQLDDAALAAAEARVLAWLDTIDRADQRKGMWLNLAGAVAFNLLVVLVLFLIWMVWAGEV